MSVADIITLGRIALQATLMRDSCVIVRPRVLSDGAGSTYPDPAGPLSIGPIVCTFSKMRGREQEIADQVQSRGDYRLALPVATDIRLTDQVAVLSGVYNVVWAPPVAALSLSRVVGLEEAS